MSLDNRQTDVYIYVCVCCCVVRDKNTRGRHFTNPSSVRYPSTLLILFNTQQHERQREREKKREKERAKSCVKKVAIPFFGYDALDPTLPFDRQDCLECLRETLAKTIGQLEG